MALILHANTKNKNAVKALIAAEYSGVKVELVGDFEMGVSNKTPRVSPNESYWEVARLKVDNPVCGSSLIEYAHIEQWIDFSSLEIDVNILRWFIPRIGYAMYIPEVEEAAVSALKRALEALNKHLASNTYLVGHSVTLADIVMTCFGFIRVLTKSFTSEFPHVESTFGQWLISPISRRYLAKEEPKKEVRKEPAKPTEEAPTEAEEAPKPKPKPKNPLDLLPPRFWDMYDPEGYSLWFCDYKYNDENTVSFVTLNKVSGFLQRMDLARKYAFGKMLVIGSEPPFKVKGLCLFRGQEIPQFVLDECYDMELYEWKKVDINDEAQKERVNQMIQDNEPFEGEALLDAKCFK
ncbi:hypothetical protein Cgig2_013469 [Carnegiea gigantea]|uniref:Elongation factor 1-gamma n=1 Tax=Carnegiea gigantea TaxID=171969 RepID=A0A9Q1K4U3_9CARY|nr:hypothetical protein Cgig2_013469 [Carnegiea gigantea]